MSQAEGIVICGLNGCGKTTLGRALAEATGFYSMDVEDYYFQDAIIPYSSSRTKEEVKALLLEDIKKHPRFILSCVRANEWGSEINDHLALAVVLTAPAELRMRRIEEREIRKFGSRVLPGGDMFEQQSQFRAKAAARTEDMVENSLQSLICPILRLNAAKPIEENIHTIIRAYRKETAMQENALTIQVRYHADIPPLEKLPQGDWIDLRAAETLDMKAGEFRLISLGVSMKLPQGYEAHVAPRSSTFKKWGILMTNSVGVIDESYCGDNDLWYFSAVALRDTHIEKGDRICQFRLMKKMPDAKIQTVAFLSAPDRGGIGSTGEK